MRLRPIGTPELNLARTIAELARELVVENAMSAGDVKANRNVATFEFHNIVGTRHVVAVYDGNLMIARYFEYDATTDLWSVPLADPECMAKFESELRVVQFVEKD